MQEGLDQLLGLEYGELSPERVQARIAVRDELKQQFGLVHGGVYAAIAESLASVGTALAVMADGKRAMGMSNSTTFMRPILDGTIHAEGLPRHRGRTSWIWDVDIRDDEGRLCASSRLTIAVRAPLNRESGS